MTAQLHDGTTAMPLPGGSQMTETAPTARRATAHDHRQLAGVLGWTVVQVDKAVILGVLPPYDLKTPRWKAATVNDLAGRREELAAVLDDAALLTEDEMMTQLGLEWGDWRRGRDHDVIPGPDRGGFWSREAAEGLAAHAGRLREEIPPQPLGARRREDRIRAHVILCWLALLLARITENACGGTWPELHELDRIHVGTFTGPAGTSRQRTEITRTQTVIFKALDISAPPRIYQLKPAVEA